MANQVVTLFTDDSSISANNKVRRKRKHDDLRAREHLYPEELRALFLAARHHSRNALRDELMLRLMFNHALRVSELVGLTWARIDMDHALIQVRRAKNGRYRDHAIKGKELELLRKYHKAQRATLGHLPLFVSEQGTRVHPNTVNHVVRTNGLRAKLPAAVQPLHAHMLRHSCATFLRSQGKDLPFIADRLGHRNMASSHRYTAVDGVRDDDIDYDQIG